MSYYEVKIIDIKKAASDTFCIKVEKPDGYLFIPGQFTGLSFDEINPNNERTLFCFTNSINDNYLEFIIKYNNNGNLLVKNIINSVAGEKIRIGKPQGSFRYKGKGTFIVAGTGITPALSIFRNLWAKNNLAGNRLIYSNKTFDDVIQHNELSEMLNTDYINLFTKQRYNGFYFGRIDKNFLRMHITYIEQYFYINGSFYFVHNIISILKELNVPDESILFEEAILNKVSG
ncbi:MAG: hypothetical protein RBR74_00870 [Ignavibacteriaceae bacterium]|jgi:ferredoxin-NADP reductase|nr:hypothetical protein [Ignavibacteriaceae bacterium]